jgi:hypothetical protein
MHSLNTIKEQNKSNAKKLIDLTIKNGGVSFNNNLVRLTLKEGFAVGIKPIKEVNESFSNDKKVIEKILNTLEPFKASYIDEKGKEYKCFYGLWVSELGVFYLDGCIQILDYQTAVNYGKHFEQKAIYDFKNEIEINLEGGK